MQTTILSVIPITLLLFSFGVAMEPTYPDRELPLLKGDPYGSDKVNDVVTVGVSQPPGMTPFRPFRIRLTISSNAKWVGMPTNAS